MARFIQKIYRTQNACFDFLCNFFSETFLILRRTGQDIIVNVLKFSCKALVILLQILMKGDFFPDKISKNTQIQNFMKMHPAVAELFHADGWTHREGRTGGQTKRHGHVENNSNTKPFCKRAYKMVCR